MTHPQTPAPTAPVLPHLADTELAKHSLEEVLMEFGGEVEVLVGFAELFEMALSRRSLSEEGLRGSAEKIVNAVLRLGEHWESTDRQVYVRCTAAEQQVKCGADGAKILARMDLDDAFLLPNAALSPEAA